MTKSTEFGLKVWIIFKMKNFSGKNLTNYRHLKKITVIIHHQKTNPKFY